MLRVAAAVTVGACVLSGCAAQSAPRSHPGPRAFTATDVAQAVPAPGTFVSLVPACACGRHTHYKADDAAQVLAVPW